MLYSLKNTIHYSQTYSQKMNGKLNFKIKIKDDYIRADGSCALYVQVFLNGRKKIFPLNISVAPNHFDKAKQRVSNSFKNHKDYNLIIEKFLADINTIEINYRLSGVMLDIEKLTEEVLNPSSWICFVTFWEEELNRQKGLLKPGTYRQQKSALEKLRKYKPNLFFYQIDKKQIEDIHLFLKVEMKNEPNTISTFFKNFKKYLNVAFDRGIKIPIKSIDIKRPNFKSHRTFLMPEEINLMYKYWKSEFINETHKNVLSKFLFSCFTGLRISDIKKIDQDNFIGDYLVFVSEKTGKLQRIQLNESAKRFIGKNKPFESDYTDEYTNRTIKDICKIIGIKKRVTYHVSRHTFATNFILSGGNVTVLQKLLGHSKIEDTMIYVHIAESITDIEILNLDTILIIDTK